MARLLRYWTRLAIGAAWITLAAGAIGKSALLFHPVAARQRMLAESLVLAVLVLFEVGLAWWLASGAAPRAGRAVALATFLLFSCVTGWKVWQGATDCGCFGIVQVPPVVMLPVDLWLVVGLAIGSWKKVAARTRWRRSALGILCGGHATIALLAGWMVYSIHGADSAPTSIRVAWERTPTGTIPYVLRYVKGCRELKTGEWLLLFYRENCRQCESQFTEFAKVDGKVADLGMAVVVVPPYNNGLYEGESHSSVRWFPLTGENSLTGGIAWVIDTPVVVYLVDGKFERHYETVSEAMTALKRGAAL